MEDFEWSSDAVMILCCKDQANRAGEEARGMRRGEEGFVPALVLTFFVRSDSKRFTPFIHTT